MRSIYLILVCLLFSVGSYSQFIATLLPIGEEDSPLLDSLFAYYPFEEASGNALDAHNSYDLTVNGPTVEQNGKVNYCYSYTTNDYVGYEDNDDFDFDGTFSLSFWFKTSYSAAWRSIVANYGDATHGWEIIHSPTYIYWRMRNTTSEGLVTGGTNIRDGAWHHVAVSNSAADDSMKLWVDGSADGTFQKNINGVDYNSSCRLTIGSQLLSAYFEGYIDEVAFYRGLELTHRKVLDLYGEGTPPTYPLDY